MTTDRTWPTVGQKLVRRKSRTNEQWIAEVVAVDRERRKVSVRMGSTVYPSLSTAAQAITGVSVNGWVFWGLKPRRPRLPGDL
jgi:hypothetical protein